MKNRVTMKNIVRMDIRITLLGSFMWSLLTPYTSNLKGLLSTETLAVFMILGSLSMETLMILSKRTTLKTSFKYVIIYDIIYLIILTSSWILLDKKEFIFIVTAATVPYWPLIGNYENKLRAFIGEHYPRYFVEKVLTKTTMLDTRVGLIAMGVTALVSLVAPDPGYIVPLFIFIAFIEIVYSIIVYNRYYYNFKG